MKDLIKYSYRVGVYISSYDLAKLYSKKHQNLMATVKRKHKYYIHYSIQNHRYYKNQKIYLLTPNIIRKINKNGVYDEVLKEMKELQNKKSEEIRQSIERLFNK